MTVCTCMQDRAGGSSQSDWQAAALPGKRGSHRCRTCSQWAQAGDHAGRGRVQDVHPLLRLCTTPAQSGAAPLSMHILPSSQGRTLRPRGETLSTAVFSRRSKIPICEEPRQCHVGSDNGITETAEDCQGQVRHDAENGDLCRTWLTSVLGPDSVAKHMVAVSTNLKLVVGVWHRPQQCLCLLGLGGRPLLRLLGRGHAAARAAVRLRARGAVPGSGALFRRNSALLEEKLCTSSQAVLLSHSPLTKASSANNMTAEVHPRSTPFKHSVYDST